MRCDLFNIGLKVSKCPFFGKTPYIYLPKKIWFSENQLVNLDRYTANNDKINLLNKINGLCLISRQVNLQPAHKLLIYCIFDQIKAVVSIKY